MIVLDGKVVFDDMHICHLPSRGSESLRGRIFLSVNSGRRRVGSLILDSGFLNESAPGILLSPSLHRAAGDFEKIELRLYEDVFESYSSDWLEDLHLSPAIHKIDRDRFQSAVLVMSGKDGVVCAIRFRSTPGIASSMIDLVPRIRLNLDSRNSGLYLSDGTLRTNWKVTSEPLSMYTGLIRAIGDFKDLSSRML